MSTGWHSLVRWTATRMEIHRKSHRGVKKRYPKNARRAMLFLISLAYDYAYLYWRRLSKRPATYFVLLCATKIYMLTVPTLSIHGSMFPKSMQPSYQLESIAMSPGLLYSHQSMYKTIDLTYNNPTQSYLYPHLRPYLRIQIRSAPSTHSSFGFACLKASTFLHKERRGYITTQRSPYSIHTVRLTFPYLVHKRIINFL